MNQEEIKNMVNEVFITEFEISPELLQGDKQLFQDLGLDSLDIVDLIVALQRKFAVRLRDNQEVRNVRTLNDIYTYVYNTYQNIHNTN